LPGTLAENEISPVVKKVEEVIEKGGGKELSVKDLGKSRIAYPVKHIRYGYFQLCNFEAETKDIGAIRNNLGLMNELLRMVVRIAGKEESIPDKISAISDVTVRDAVKERENEPVRAVREEQPKPSEDVEASHQIDAKKPAKAKSREKTETKAENIKMEDIDKKLDELLESNIADV